MLEIVLETVNLLERFYNSVNENNRKWKMQFNFQRGENVPTLSSSSVMGFTEIVHEKYLLTCPGSRWEKQCILQVSIFNWNKYFFNVN